MHKMKKVKSSDVNIVDGYFVTQTVKKLWEKVEAH